MKKWKILAVLFAALIIIGLPLMGLADAGNFSGDSDYGSDSSWDSSDSDWGDSDSGYYSDGDGIGLSPTLIFIIIVVVYFALRKGKTTPSGGKQQQQGRTASIDELKNQDPDFSEQDFLERAGNIYVQIQDAWEAKQWEPMRAVMTDAMFNQFNRQLQEYIDNKQTNHVDRISVLGADITRYAQDDTNDILTVLLRTRIVDYVTSDETGELIRGSNSKELFMTYEYTYIRRKGVKTQKKEQVSTVNCPNCGAPLSINQSGKCEYCGSVVSHGEYDWVISNIKGISQRSS